MNNKEKYLLVKLAGPPTDEISRRTNSPEHQQAIKDQNTPGTPSHSAHQQKVQAHAMQKLRDSMPSKHIMAAPKSLPAPAAPKPSAPNPAAMEEGLRQKLRDSMPSRHLMSGDTNTGHWPGLDTTGAPMAEYMPDPPSDAHGYDLPGTLSSRDVVARDTLDPAAMQKLRDSMPSKHIMAAPR